MPLYLLHPNCVVVAMKLFLDLFVRLLQPGAKLRFKHAKKKKKKNHFTIVSVCLLGTNLILSRSIRVSTFGPGEKRHITRSVMPSAFEYGSSEIGQHVVSITSAPLEQRFCYTR